MKKNTGFIDRLIRIVIGLLIVAAGLYYQSLWGVVAVIPLASGLTGFCPLYGAFGLSTRRSGEKAFDLNN